MNEDNSTFFLFGKLLEELGIIVLGALSPILIPPLEWLDSLLRKLNERFDS